MTRRQQASLAVLAALGIAIAATAPAMAQGTTSGPAAGGNVQPSATTQKQKSVKQSDHQSGGGAVSTGDVGVEAKQGSEGGSAPSGKPAPR